MVFATLWCFKRSCGSLEGSLGFHLGLYLRFHLGFHLRFYLGFHSRVSYQDFFSRCLNVQVGSFRVPLGFHLGCNLGFL